MMSPGIYSLHQLLRCRRRPPKATRELPMRRQRCSRRLVLRKAPATRAKVAKLRLDLGKAIGKCGKTIGKPEEIMETIGETKGKLWKTKRKPEENYGKS